MIDVASALEYLHHGYSSSIVHCDIKPSNILLDDNMVAHVADFGNAKLLNSTEIHTMVQTGTLATIGYMAPGNLFSLQFKYFQVYTTIRQCYSLFFCFFNKNCNT